MSGAALVAWAGGSLLETGTERPDPSLSERQDLLLEHFESLLEHYGAYKGLRVARKHVAWSVHGLSGANAFRETFNLLDDPLQAREALRAFFLLQLERLVA